MLARHPYIDISSYVASQSSSTCTTIEPGLGQSAVEQHGTPHRCLASGIVRQRNNISSTRTVSCDPFSSSVRVGRTEHVKPISDRIDPDGICVTSISCDGQSNVQPADRQTSGKGQASRKPGWCRRETSPARVPCP